MNQALLNMCGCSVNSDPKIISSPTKTIDLLQLPFHLKIDLDLLYYKYLSTYVLKTNSTALGPTLVFLCLNAQIKTKTCFDFTEMTAVIHKSFLIVEENVQVH